MQKPKAKRSGKWPYARRKHLKTEPACQWCGQTTHLQVHHIKPYHLFPELELVPDNFITLCEFPNHSCHLRVGHLGAWVRYNQRVRQICNERQALNAQRLSKP